MTLVNDWLMVQNTRSFTSRWGCGKVLEKQICFRVILVAHPSTGLSSVTYFWVPGWGRLCQNQGVTWREWELSSIAIDDKEKEPEIQGKTPDPEAWLCFETSQHQQHWIASSDMSGRHSCTWDIHSTGDDTTTHWSFCRLYTTASHDNPAGKKMAYSKWLLNRV